MENLVAEEILKQYGLAGGLLLLMGYFLLCTVPNKIAPLFVKVIQNHLQGMVKAWDAHKERLDQAERRSEERHRDVLDASREGTRQLIEYLQKIHHDHYEHDKHTIGVHNRLGKLLNTSLSHKESSE